MPNTISQRDLEDLRVSDSGNSLTLARAGWIRPSVSRDSCHATVDDVFGCVLYVQIVDGRAMKFGTTAELKTRMRGYAKTASTILQYQSGKIENPEPWLTQLEDGKGDPYKKLAPDVLRAGKSIEIWAVSLSTPRDCQNDNGQKRSRCASCRSLEGACNDRYQTAQVGWAARRS